LVSSTP